MGRIKDKWRQRREQREDAMSATFAYLSDRALAEAEAVTATRGQILEAFDWYPGQVMIFNRLVRRFERDNPTFDFEQLQADGEWLEKFLAWLSTVDWQQVIAMVFDLISLIMTLIGGL